MAAGVSKEEAKLDRWMKEIAPSDELREWFGHDLSKWKGFREKYREELDQKRDLLEELKTLAEEGNLTLLYAAKDEEHKNAVVLDNVLEEIS